MEVTAELDQVDPEEWTTVCSSENEGIIKDHKTQLY